MAAKQAILLHLDGIQACEQNDWLKAVAIFQQIEPPTSMIVFNIGCCYLQLKNFLEAEVYFGQCVAKDRYLSVGYFQLGIAQTHLAKYASAIETFKSCHEALRGNAFIHYKQLNLDCKIYDRDIRFNLALLYLFLGEVEIAREQLMIACSYDNDNKQQTNVDKALDALTDQNWDWFGNTPLVMLIILPSTTLFKPSKAKLEGIQSNKNFLSTAKVVSATNDDYSFVGFVGAKKLQRQRENDLENATESSEVMNVVPPPLPSIVPPRRGNQFQGDMPSIPLTKPPSAPLKGSRMKMIDLRNIPSPPSVSPPPLTMLQSPSKMITRPTSPIAKPVPAKPTFLPPPRTTGSSLGNVQSPKKPPMPMMKPPTSSNKKPERLPLATPDTKPGSKIPPKPRPPLPSKLKQSFDLSCDFTISLKLPKQQVTTYDDLTHAICKNLENLCQNMRLQADSLNLSACFKSNEVMMVVNQNSWKEIYSKAMEQTGLKLFTKNIRNAGPDAGKVAAAISEMNFKRSLFSPVPTNATKLEENADVYVDANAHVMYTGTENGKNDEIYSEAVFDR